MKPLERIQAEIDADPVAKARWDEVWRKSRPTHLKAAAWIESIFPPESPTSAARGGKKTALEPEMMEAVCWILDANTIGKTSEANHAFEVALKKGDADFFRLMAEASEYVKNMQASKSMFAKHVIAARRVAARMMGTEGPLPSWRDVKAEVLKRLGQAAYGETSKEWGRVKTAAGLSDLPR